MQSTLLLLSVALGVAILGFSPTVSFPDEQASTAKEGQPKVILEKVDGPVRFGGRITKLTGKAKALDAHTLQFEDGQIAELNGGMDAPELEQKGLIGDTLYPCGKEARDFLQKLIDGRDVVGYDVEVNKKDGKLRGTFFVDEKSIESEMVRNGWAISHHSGTEGWEAIARENKRGLFRGKFIAPEKWRKGERLKGE
jgi:endonuclease YncB( thermonuclease family)